MTRFPRCVPRCCFLLALFLLPPARAGAQTDSLALTITEVDTSRFPTIYLKVKIFRAGTMLTRLDAANFALFENTIPQVIEAVDCPADTGRRFSVAILLDRSGSMARDAFNQTDSSKIWAAKSATRLFLDFLEPRDEACIYSFASTMNRPPVQYFAVNQNFTSDVDLLKRSLVPISAVGSTWIWQAMERTLDSLKSRQGRRIMIVLTDGQSQNEGWLHTATTVINKAAPLGIPIYLIGLGTDIAVSELSAIANATAGKFYESPGSAELESAFRQLAIDVITDACELRYTTQDICKDGSQRTIDLLAHTAGLLAEDTATYRAPSGLTRYTVALDPPTEVSARESFRVPVLLREGIGFAPLDYTFRFSWPDALLRFDSVATAGCISEGALLQVAAAQPGTVTVTARSIIPARVAGSFFELAFTSRAVAADLVAGIVVDSQHIAQGCPTIVTADGAQVTVRPCERSYTVGSELVSLLGPGDRFRVPVDIAPAPEAGMPWALTLVVRYDADALEYEGVDSAGGLAAAGGIAVTSVKGRLTLTLHGTARGDRTLLLALLFRAKSLRESRAVTVEIDGSDLRTDCIDSVANASPFVLINGVCEGIVTRPAAGQHLAVSPNPARGPAELRVTVADEGPAVIDILDEGGRVAARVLDAVLARGEHRVTLATGALPAGRYLVTMTTAAGRSARPLVLLR